ncbi:MAG TPA: hypothetical protein VML96_11460 [Egibacteraceae bacterium]|nr:hypothetical protein [Egibacteraceae bacterium]
MAADGHTAEKADKRGSTADGEDGSWSRPSRSRQYAKALAEICAAWLGGGSGKPAKPLYVAGIDLSQVSVRADGTIMLAVRGDLPRISSAALERLANDADLRAVLFDGARPLAASKKVSMASIPEAIRFAVAARDRGCRFPASPDPIAHTDIHHLHERSRGGDHHPDKLAAVSRRFHTLAHDRGWTLILDPDTGQITARRGTRAWMSMPKGTPLAWPDGLPPPTSGSDARGEPRGPDPGAAHPHEIPAEGYLGRERPAAPSGDPPEGYTRDWTLPF